MLKLKTGTNAIALTSAYKAYLCADTVLIKVPPDSLDFVDENKCLLALLDCSAANDTISQAILVKRLNETYGLSGTVLK